MPHTFNRIPSFIATVTLVSAVTVLVGLPSRVNADGKAEAAAREQSTLARKVAAPENTTLAKDESKIGELVILTELAESDSTPGKRVIHLECQNPTDQKIAGKLAVELTRTKGNPMGRVMRQSQTAWRHTESVEVEPGTTLTRDIPLPKDIGAEVARIDKARKVAEQSETAQYPNVYYGVIAVPTEGATARGKVRSGSSSKLSLVMPRGSDVFGY